MPEQTDNTLSAERFDPRRVDHAMYAVAHPEEFEGWELLLAQETMDEIGSIEIEYGLKF